MKKQILVVLAVISTFFAQGQEAGFCNVALSNVNDRESLSFTVTRETNVRHYRIEASNNNTDFEVIATVPSKGNSMTARTYSYGLAGYNYQYYRVAIVEMGSGMPYSAVVSKDHSQPNEVTPPRCTTPGNSIVSNSAK